MYSTKSLYSRTELEHMSIAQVMKIFIQTIPEAKNLIIEHLSGPKPLDYLPSDVIGQIYDFLPFSSKINFIATCHQYYKWKIPLINQYCLQRDTLIPFVNCNNEFVKEIVSSWNMGVLRSSIENLIRGSKFGENELQLIIFIYHITNSHSIWKNIRNRNYRLCYEFWNDKFLIRNFLKYDTFTLFICRYSTKLNHIIPQTVRSISYIRNVTAKKLDIAIKNIKNINRTFLNYPSLELVKLLTDKRDTL